MKKSKILLPLALLGMVFGMVACNSNNGNEGGNQQGGDQSNTPVETDPAKQEKINITSPDGKKSILFGETLQLSADQEGVSWESSKPEVATISATGLVTAVSKGSTTIKATKAGFKDGSFNLSVNYPDITVTASGEKDILIGGKVTLTASEQGVTWTSSDPEVAKVENGVVTGLKLGTATIKASKEHFNDGIAVINVVRPEASAKLDLVVAADHYSADGWWELPSAGGFGFAMQQVAGWNPTSQAMSWGQGGEEPAETFVGGFGVGDKETVKFTAAAAGKAELVLDIGNSDEVALGTVMSAKLNGTAIDLSEVTLEAHAGQFGNSLEFGELSLGELDLVAGENTIVFEFLADTNIFLNELHIYAGGAVTLVPPAAKEQIVINATETEVIAESSITLTADQAGVTWVSLDEEVATVNEAGVVTGVKMGKVNIRAKKDGFYSAQVEITVNPKPVAGQILLEAESAAELEGIEPGGFGQGTPTINQDGSGWGGSSEVHSGGAYVSMFGGDSLTLTFTFTATEAKTMVLSVVGSAPMSFGGEAAPFVWGDSATITLNEEAVTIGAEAEFPAPEGWSSTMTEVTIGDVQVKAGDNTLVVNITGSIPSLDVFKLSVKE